MLTMIMLHNWKYFVVLLKKYWTIDHIYDAGWWCLVFALFNGAVTNEEALIVFLMRNFALNSFQFPFYALIYFALNLRWNSINPRTASDVFLNRTYPKPVFSRVSLLIIMWTFSISNANANLKSFWQASIGIIKNNHNILSLQCIVNDDVFKVEIGVLSNLLSVFIKIVTNNIFCFYQKRFTRLMTFKPLMINYSLNFKE